jgi:hypothetical protein
MKTLRHVRILLTAARNILQLTTVTSKLRVFLHSMATLNGFFYCRQPRVCRHKKHYCIPIATMVTRKRHNVTFYVYGLQCLLKNSHILIHEHVITCQICFHILSRLFHGKVKDFFFHFKCICGQHNTVSRVTLFP